MSTENTAPSAEGTSTTTAATQPPSPSAPAQDAGAEPNWLPMRLAQAKRSAESDLLKTLGVADVEAAKTALANAQKIEDEKKSEIQRLTEAAAALKPLAEKAPTLEARIAKIADAEIAKLTPEQSAAVLGLAGDDKSRVLDVIEALRPTWVSPTATQAKPPPATTTAATRAPSDTTPAPTDHKAVYASLKQTAPYEAAQYLLAHKREIYPDTAR